MKIIEYFTSENKKHWLDEMKKCDYRAEIADTGIVLDDV